MKKGSTKTYETLKRKIKSTVQSENSYTICITVKNDDVHVLGEKNLVNLVKNEANSITFQQICSKLSNMHSEASTNNLEFEDLMTETIPKLNVKFKSSGWNHVVA